MHGGGPRGEDEQEEDENGRGGVDLGEAREKAERREGKLYFVSKINFPSLGRAQQICYQRKYDIHLDPLFSSVLQDLLDNISPFKVPCHQTTLQFSDAQGSAHLNLCGATLASCPNKPVCLV